MPERLSVSGGASQSAGAGRVKALTLVASAGGTTQSARGSSDVSQLTGYTKVRLASFNAGLSQHRRKTLEYEKLSSAVAGSAHQEAVDIWCLCDVGGPLQAAGFNHNLRMACRQDSDYKVAYQENYMMIHNFRDTSKDRVRPTGNSRIITLPGSVHQMMVQRFELEHGQILIVGNLHIGGTLKMPIGASPVTDKTRQRCVEHALRLLGEEDKFWRQLNKSYDVPFQVVVLALVGDCNLTTRKAEEVTRHLQPQEPAHQQWYQLWRVVTSEHGESGDLAFIKGAHVKGIELHCGCNYPWSGVGNDRHDALGLELRIPARRSPQVPCVGKPQAPVKRNLDDGASQSVCRRFSVFSVPRKNRGPRRCSQSWQPEDTWAVLGDNTTEDHRAKLAAEQIKDELLKWWHQLSRNESQSTHETANQLDHLTRLFAKRMKATVPQDLWFIDPAQADDGFHENLEVSVPVSDVYVLNQLQQVLAFRNKWLASQGIHDLEWTMPDGKGYGSRGAFLKYAKDLYHNSAQQQAIQQQERAEGLSGKVKQKRKGRRWNRHLQRSCGTHQLWQMISFTGRLDSEFLMKLDPDDKDAPPPEPVGAPPPETVDACRAHVNEARQWRRALSHAEALHARRLKNWWWICFTPQEQAILDSYDNDELRTHANEATRLAGWGRIKNSDGSWTDLKRHDGGIVRKLLRPAPPPVGGILL